MAKEKLNWEDEQVRHDYRHTASHIMAQAVKHLWPDTKLAIGPAIDNGFYYEGSVRYGKVTSDYSSSNVWAGHDVSYDNSAKYWGAHVGVGKLQKLGGDNAIDLYGKLFYTNQGSSSVNIDGDTLDFSSVKSKRSRIGFRYPLWHDAASAQGED